LKGLCVVKPPKQFVFGHGLVVVPFVLDGATLVCAFEEFNEVCIFSFCLLCIS
jgi:hypothetical protein